MTITRVQLESGQDTSDSDFTSKTIGSFSTTANRLAKLSISSGCSVPGDNVVPTITDANRTWVQVSTVVNAANWSRTTVFRCMETSGKTGDLDIEWSAGQSACEWEVEEFDAVDTGGTSGSAAIVQSATNSTTGATALSVSMASFGDATNNVAFGVFGTNMDNATSYTHGPGSGFVELVDLVFAANGWSEGLMVEWKTGEDTGIDMTTTKSTDIGGIGIEIGAASGTTHLGAAVVSGTGNVAAVATVEYAGVVAIVASGDIAAAGLVLTTHLGAAVVTGTGLIDASGTIPGNLLGAAAINAVGSLAAAAAVDRLAQTSISALGTIDAIAAVEYAGAASIVASGILSALGHSSAAVEGQVNLLCTGIVTPAASIGWTTVSTPADGWSKGSPPANGWTKLS